MNMMEVNFIAVVLCAVAAMILGYVWYGPMLFGKTWQKEAGVSDAQAKKANMTTMYVGMFVAALVEAYVLSVVLGMMGSLTLMSAATGAFWVWLGFIAATMVGSVLAEGKSTTYFGIVAGYQLVLVVIMSTIIVTL